MVMLIDSKMEILDFDSDDEDSYEVLSRSRQWKDIFKVLIL